MFPWLQTFGMLEVCASFFSSRWELVKESLLTCNAYKLCQSEASEDLLFH